MISEGLQEDKQGTVKRGWFADRRSKFESRNREMPVEETANLKVPGDLAVLSNLSSTTSPFPLY